MFQRDDSLHHQKLMNRDDSYHYGGFREGAGTAALVGIIGFVAVVVSGLEGLAQFAAIVVVVTIALLSGILVWRWIGRLQTGRRDQEEEEARAARENERDNQLEAAKASGAFDRWEKPS